MSILEMKGEIHELIAVVQDEGSVEKLLRVIRMFVRTETGLGADEWFQDMPAEMIADLEAAIAESYQDEAGIPHDDLMKQAREWLKK